MYEYMCIQVFLEHHYVLLQSCRAKARLNCHPAKNRNATEQESIQLSPAPQSPSPWSNDLIEKNSLDLLDVFLVGGDWNMVRYTNVLW